jgi:hypothetical protein
MNHHCLISRALALGFGLAFSIASPVGGQGAAKPNTEAKAWTASRTPDGQPDLQGFWTNATYTPLQRPKNITKEFYTEKEAVELRTSGRADGGETTSPNTSIGAWLATGSPDDAPQPGSVADVHYDFSQFGLARNQSTFVETLRTSLIVEPRDGRLPPLTPEGQKRIAERAKAIRESGGRWGAAQNNELDDRCIIMNAGPPIVPWGYNNNYQIVQGPGYVMILVEMIHDARIIPLDGRPHVSKNIRQWMGHSRGYWEGDTLVVETTNFNGKTAFQGSSENLRVVERFTRVADNTIRYEFTADDPATWTTPWSAEAPMRRTLGPLIEFACHEGNYSLSNALSGARAEEKRATDKATRKESK